MTDFIPYNRKRQIIDVPDFLDKKDNSYLICINGAMIYALRVMAKTRLLWQSSYAAERYEQHYTPPDAEEFDIIEDVVSEFLADTDRIEMCNQLLLDALAGLSNTIRLSSCCFEGGPGSQTIDDDFYWGTETSLDAPTEFGVGEEFETEAAWELHKCEVANGIINGLIGSLNGMSTLTHVTLLAASVLALVVGLGLIFVPPVAIIAAIVGTGLAFSFFSTLANEIADNKALLVCGLYGSTTAQNAYDSLRSNMDDLAVDLGVIEVQLGPLLDLIMQMAPIDTMNALFRAQGLPAIGGATVDCGNECGECPHITVYWGYFDAGSGVFESEEGDVNVHYASMKFNYDGDDYCGDPVTIDSITELVGTPDNEGPAYGYRLINQADVSVYSDENDPPGAPVNLVGFVHLLNDYDTPFTVNVQYT